MTRASKIVTLFLLMLAQACGGPIDGPAMTTGKGDGEQIMDGWSCAGYEIGATSGDLTCTGATKENWVPHVWSKTPCSFNGQLIARGTRVGPLLCVDGRPVPSPSVEPPVWDTEVYYSEDFTRSALEGQPCDAIGDGIGPLVCTAKSVSEWVPDIWSESICYYNGHPIRGDAQICHIGG